MDILGIYLQDTGIIYVAAILEDIPLCVFQTNWTLDMFIANS